MLTFQTSISLRNTNIGLSEKRAKHEEINCAVQEKLQQISMLKTQQNELAPISLPADIMIIIFSHVQKGRECIQFDIPGAEVQDIRNELRWIQTISHVCACWRDIAMNCSGLWTSPPFDNSRWAAEMVKRSKDANLSVIFDFHSVRTASPVIIGLRHALNDHGSRIRALDLSAVPQNQ